MIASPFSEGPSQPAPRWALTREFVLGEGDPEVEAAFSKIKAVRVSPNGNVFVADARSRQVRMFDRDGRHRKLVMRDGRGPGDVTNLGEMGVLADTLWTTDLNLRRLTQLTQNGEVVRTIPFDQRSKGAVGEPASVALAGLLPNGEAIGLGETRHIIFESYERGIPHLLLRTSRSAKALDTIGSVSIKNRVTIFRDGPSMILTIQRFSDAPLVRVDGNGARAYVVDRTVSANAKAAVVTVTAIKPNGDTLWTRTLPYPPRRIEKSAADSFRREVERAHAGTSLKQRDREKLAFIPPHRPPVSEAIVSADGNLWLRREEGQAQVEYWVLNRQGVLIGSIVLPRTTSVMEANGAHVWGVETDADDVPRVVRFSVRRQ
ncbi:hypothetical protein [Gemmatimonas sp.]